MDSLILRKQQVLHQARNLCELVQQDLATRRFGSDDVRMRTYNNLIAEAAQRFPEDPVLNGRMVIMPDAVLQAYGTFLPITAMPFELPSQRLKEHLTCLINRLELVLEEPGATTSIIVNPIFRTRNIAQEPDLCFVLMPFNSAFDRLYREEIKPTVEAAGFKCLRADDLFSPTPVLEDIWVHIYKSRVIIADVTGRNPNVFYEMGIAHTAGRPVVIITQERAAIPFDIAQFRYFVYSDDAQGWSTLCTNIASALRSVIPTTSS